MSVAAVGDEMLEELDGLDGVGDLGAFFQAL